jgi:deoxyadenosine/deoxycytidine kinase
MAEQPSPETAPPSPDSDHVTLITIEGGIGAGKSTVMNSLRMARPDLVFIDEPVGLWESSGLLTAMYNGTVNPGTFQIAALATRVAPLMAAIRRGARTIVTERCPYSDYRVFTQANLELGSVELKAYQMAYHSLLQAMPTMQVHIVYLRSEVDTLLERMKTRGRAAEAVNDDDQMRDRREYLEKLQKRHDEFYEWPSASSRVQIDASLSAPEVASRATAAVDRICAPALRGASE